MLNPKLSCSILLSLKVLNFYFEMGTVKVNLATKHNYALPSKTSVTLLLFYGLISNLPQA